MTSSDGTTSGQVTAVDVNSAGAATATLSDGNTISFTNGANVQ
jgi:hypothetical protein